MDDEFKDLQTLLRLKKYEQPTEGFERYSEQFLKEFHRRQRWESARKSGIAAWFERLSEWIDLITVPRSAYVATLAIFGIIAIGINSRESATLTADAGAVKVPTVQVNSRRALALNSPLDLSELETQSRIQTGSPFSNSEIQPRYILDARPASYDASFSF